MTTELTTQELRQQLTAHLDSVAPPPADLDAVRRRSRSSKLRRLAGPGVLAAAAVGIGALVLSQPPEATSPDAEDDGVVATDGPLDLAEGLRAYASPDGRLHLGGTSVEMRPGMDVLDTEAAATPYGLVYTDPAGRVQLLGADGSSEALTGPSDTPSGWRPTAKADAAQPHVVFATLRGEDATVTVYDLEDRSVVASTDIMCADTCADMVIDGIDSGAVFIRMPSGTGIWDYERLETFMFAGPETRVADVRNGVVLHDGPAPDQNTEGWRLLRSPVDAQLTFDGEHVLYWSSTLAPTRDSGTPLVLEEGPADGEDGLAWWSLDTDGSVLVAVAQPAKPGGNLYMGDNLVYDCALPTGACEELGPLTTSSGDPVFIGSDM